MSKYEKSRTVECEYMVPLSVGTKSLLSQLAAGETKINLGVVPTLAILAARVFYHRTHSCVRMGSTPQDCFKISNAACAWPLEKTWWLWLKVRIYFNFLMKIKDRFFGRELGNHGETSAMRCRAFMLTSWLEKLGRGEGWVMRDYDNDVFSRRW